MNNSVVITFLISVSTSVLWWMGRTTNSNELDINIVKTVVDRLEKTRIKPVEGEVKQLRQQIGTLKIDVEMLKLSTSILQKNQEEIKHGYYHLPDPKD